MSDILEKILKIVIGEIIGAFIFIICLIILNALPIDEVSSQLTSFILVIWGIYGIGTPIVIFTEIENEIFNIFEGLK